ncbi:MAG: glycosyltransferase, partial [Gammaproteobacteria bacterium]
AIWPLPVQPPVLDPVELLPTGHNILLAVGRLTEGKQPGHLIEAFKSLASDCPQWTLVFLGDGPLRDALELQVREYGLQGRVLLPGRAGNIGHWYEHADLYAMTSQFEGFPNTLAEAMAYGLPAVSYDCDTGPRDLIRHEVDGLLVPSGDIAGLTTALGRLMRDDALRHRFANRASEVRERFSMQRITEMWERLFEKLQK